MSKAIRHAEDLTIKAHSIKKDAKGIVDHCKAMSEALAAAEARVFELGSLLDVALGLMNHDIRGQYEDELERLGFLVTIEEGE